MNSEQYAEKIKHTRAGIDETLHTLEDKLSPKELWEQAIKWSEGARDFAGNLGNIVRENPIPATLMGISLIWFMTAETSRRVDHVDTSGIKSKLQGKYAEARSTVRSTTAEAGEKAKAFSSDIKHRGEHLREQSQEWKERLQASGTELSARPVLLSALGLAVGALVAMSLPVSRKEEEVLGEAGREMYRKTSEVVGEQLERGKEAASAAAEAARSKLSEEEGPWPRHKEKPPGYMESGTH
ncbi:MAG: hypothetical protein A2X81_14975 [Desulfobacterales bacterium GWB2_56_26]|nr:MAG: hypothetical protein A2X81_14975 [Desulfobacterales bacterium GWB2_56_26]